MLVYGDEIPVVEDLGEFFVLLAPFFVFLNIFS